MTQREEISRLTGWFEKWKRPFPWRMLNPGNPSFAYAIWVSEVMLQQTRAEVVIPYFSTWMQKFPTIDHLAKARLEEVMKSWEGLGYYSRARRLWEGAKFLVEEHQGRLPADYDELLKIPGFGPYTAGAVASFAFRKRAAAVDGNVARVLLRYFALEEPIDKLQTQKKLRQITLDILPEEKPWVAMEALIELGATFCSKKPRCDQCPLKMGCLAKAKGVTVLIPFKMRKETIEILHRDVLLFLCGDKTLVGQVASGKVMAGLYEFPYFERGETWRKKGMVLVRTLDPIEHSFTRFRAKLYPHLIQCEKEIPLTGYDWIPIDKLKVLPFSSGHRKLREQLEQLCNANF